ncbi:hypothetical protein LZT04_11880, partial [Vibrio fluvialis]|nr:hypothetical protein [Vibrio fluvialis]
LIDIDSHLNEEYVVCSCFISGKTTYECHNILAQTRPIPPAFFEVSKQASAAGTSVNRGDWLY